MKLKRSAHLFYIDSNYGEGTPAWFLIGKDLEDMSIDLGADVETKKNILDETSVALNGYEPSVEVSPYIADTADAIYAKLKSAAMDRIMDDAHCKTKMLEVLVEDTEATSHSAWMQDCYVVPQSIGGDTEGMQIPFDVHPTGTRTAGSATMAANRVPTFTAAAAG